MYSFQLHPSQFTTAISDQIRHVWTVKSGVKYYYKILDFINCHLSTLDLINKRLHYSSDGFSRENTQD